MSRVPASFEINAQNIPDSADFSSPTALRETVLSHFSFTIHTWRFDTIPDSAELKSISTAQQSFSEQHGVKEIFCAEASKISFLLSYT